MGTRRPSRWRPGRGSALAVAALFLAALLTPGGAGGAGITGEHPYIRLFTQAGVGSQQANTTAGVGELALWYRHVHAETANTFPLGDESKTSAADTTLAAKLVAAGVWASNYRNGSYVSQADSWQVNAGEAEDLERTAPLAVATWWPGNYRTDIAGDDASPAARLVAAVGAGETSITLSPVAAADRPTDTPATWPYVNSADADGAGDSNDVFTTGYSQSTAEYVSWVRLDDEILRIVAAPSAGGSTVVLTLRRGALGTAPSAHPAGTRALVPTYVGAKTTAAADSPLAGSPAVNKTTKALRYVVRFWEPAGYGWIARRITATFGTGLSGHDTVWLDVSGCKQYNLAAANAHPVLTWDGGHATKMTDQRWGEYHAAKVAGLHQLLPGVRLVGNDLGSGDEACRDSLMAGAYDGSVLEDWLKSTGTRPIDWAGVMGQHFRIQQNNWPALYWIRWDRDIPTAEAPRYKRFSYGAFLLGWNPDADRPQYGGPWGFARPDELYSRDLGDPLDQPPTVEDTAAGGGLYARSFSHGLVVVNPDTAAHTYDLGTGGFLDAGAGVGSSPDAQPTPVSGVVTIGPRDALVLLRTTPLPPTVAIRSPQDGQTVTGVVSVDIDAPERVAVVELLVDGTAVATDTTAPWAFSWKTAGSPSGVHRLTARAAWRDGTSGEADVTVTVPGVAVLHRITVNADTYLDERSPTRNYGTSRTLVASQRPAACAGRRYSGACSASTRIVLVKAAVPSLTGTVRSVRLRLNVTGGGGVSVTVHRAGTTWSETGVTWASSPSIQSPGLATRSIPATGWVEIDLPPSTITGPGTYALAVRTSSSSPVSFSGRESTSRPQLIIEAGS